MRWREFIDASITTSRLRSCPTANFFGLQPAPRTRQRMGITLIHEIDKDGKVTQAS